MKGVDLRLTDVSKGDLILDCGCGYPPLDILIHSKNAEYLVGLDMSKEKITKNKRFISVKIDFVLADITLLPFRNSLFSKVLCYSTIDHVEDEGKAVEEMSRVLARKGSLVLTFPNILFRPYSLLGKIMQRLGVWIFVYEKYFHPYRIEEMLRKMGLRVVRFDSQYPNKSIIGWRFGFLAVKE